MSGDAFIRQMRSQGKVLVQSERFPGFFEYKKLEDVQSDIQAGRLVEEDVVEYYPDENKVARPCPTGEKRYVKSKSF